ncbi:MAG: response regulator [Chitinophagaceae bacterium]|nr:response regulator [Oligoflexus sp.]
MTISKKVESVLIIESDQGMQKLIGNYLKNFGAPNIVTMQSSPEAIHAIESQAFDLAIVDWKTKGPSGPELYALLRREGPNKDIFIIFIAGQVTKADILQTIKDPHAKFIVKPFTEEVLFKSIRDFTKGITTQSADSSGRGIQIHRGSGHDKGLDLSIHKRSREEAPAADDIVMNRDARADAEEGSRTFERPQSEAEGTSDLIRRPGQETGTPSLMGRAGEERGIANPTGSIGRESGPQSENKNQGQETGLTKASKASAAEQGEAAAGDRGRGSETGEPGAGDPGRGSENGKAATAGEIGRENGNPEAKSEKGQEKGTRGLTKGKGIAEGVADEVSEAGVEKGVTDEAQKKKVNEFGIMGAKKPFGPPARNEESQSKGSSASSSRNIYNDIDMSDAEDANDENEVDSQGLTYKNKGLSAASSIDYRNFHKSRPAKVRAEGDTSISVLVVDEDEALTSLVQNHLVHVKTDFVDVSPNAMDAWSMLQKFDYQLIVMDWRAKGMSGLCLYNRIRSRPETRKTPVIILTGSMNKMNFRILEDKKSTLILEKPFPLHIFEEAVESVRSLHNSDMQVVELACGVIDQAYGDRKKIYENLKTTLAKVPSKFDFLLAAGQYLVFIGEFRLAQKVLESAAKIDSHNVTLMTEMAKVHLRLDQPMESLRLLTEANHFSPGNIERLCLMGEVGLDLFQTQKAREYFKNALAIDPDHTVSKRGVILTGNIERFLAQHSEGNLSEKFASTLNLIGITLVKNNEIENGIEQYHCALAFIHDSHTTARVQFNLGLAYLRSGDRKLARKWLTESLETSDGHFKKAQIWLDKVNVEDASPGLQALAEKEMISMDWDSPQFVDSLAEGFRKIMDDESDED